MVATMMNRMTWREMAQARSRGFQFWGGTQRGTGTGRFTGTGTTRFSTGSFTAPGRSHFRGSGRALGRIGKRHGRRVNHGYVGRGPQEPPPLPHGHVPCPPGTKWSAQLHQCVSTVRQTWHEMKAAQRQQALDWASSGSGAMTWRQVGIPSRRGRSVFRRR